MKKIRIITAAVAAMLMLTACGSSDSSNESKAQKTQDTSAAANESTADAPTEEQENSDDDAASTEEKKEFDESAIPVFEHNTEDTDKVNFAKVFYRSNWFGYDFFSENQETIRPELKDFFSNKNSEIISLDDLKIEKNDPDDGFMFSGTAYAIEDPDAAESAPDNSQPYIFAETDENGVIIAFAFDRDYIGDGKRTISFAAHDIKDHTFSKSFKLGSTRAEVEEAAGPGYEYNGYVFYSTVGGLNSNDPMKTFTVLEFTPDDILQRVYILNRERLK